MQKNIDDMKRWVLFDFCLQLSVNATVLCVLTWMIRQYWLLACYRKLPMITNFFIFMGVSIAVKWRHKQVTLNGKSN